MKTVLTAIPPTALDLPALCRSAPPQSAVLRFSGADARSFLQGQFSTDITRLGLDSAQFSSHNSVKGRMLLAGYLLAEGSEDVRLLLHPELLAPALKRLRMYVLRARVTLAEESAVEVDGLLGEGAADWLAAQGLPAPETPLAVAHAQGSVVMRAFGVTPRWLLLPSAALREALQSLPADDDAWRRADLRAGVPLLRAATQDRFIAQHAGLAALGGISFDKGCYTGQEIIARLHYRGTVKRGLYALAATAPCPEPGSAVLTADGESAGEVVDAVAVAGGCELSAVLRDDLASGPLMLP